ncbi:18335_t:CDS:2 [Funneliformis geosporum]|nr:18335_t:CDS:2 [Funneliformis geosporum]
MENLSSHKTESILTTNSLELDDDSLNSFYIGMKSDPPINQNMIMELEKQAQGISNELETMLRNLQSQMQTVENHCMVINDATKKSNELIELCVRIDKEFSHVQTLANQIKCIKHQVDALHSALGR